jgi:hypothetical protein
MSSQRVDVGVIWCPNQRRGKGNGWAYPPAVRRHLQALTAGKKVLQLFGGRSTWGTRMDIDPVVEPDVIADAWLPPFVRDAFDVVILDPPYLGINQQMKTQLLQAAAFVARERIIWFHTMWIAADSKLRLENAWLVRVGDSCACRCVQVFTVPEHKPIRRPRFTRGPAMKYNRWLSGEQRLPFDVTIERRRGWKSKIKTA